MLTSDNLTNDTSLRESRTVKNFKVNRSNRRVEGQRKKNQAHNDACNCEIIYIPKWGYVGQFWEYIEGCIPNRNELGM